MWLYMVDLSPEMFIHISGDIATMYLFIQSMKNYSKSDNVKYHTEIIKRTFIKFRPG